MSVNICMTYTVYRSLVLDEPAWHTVFLCSKTGVLKFWTWKLVRDKIYQCKWNNTSSETLGRPILIPRPLSLSYYAQKTEGRWKLASPPPRSKRVLFSTQSILVFRHAFLLGQECGRLWITLLLQISLIRLQLGLWLGFFSVCFVWRVPKRPWSRPEKEYSRADAAITLDKVKSLKYLSGNGQKRKF